MEPVVKISKEPDIVNLIKNELYSTHFRINVVNCCENKYQMVKTALNGLVEDTNNGISIRHYESYNVFYNDMFQYQGFMNPTWYNLFLFNLSFCTGGCVNKDCEYYNSDLKVCTNPNSCDEKHIGKTRINIIKNQIINIEKLYSDLISKLDTKYYSIILLSKYPKELLINMFEESAKESCKIISRQHMKEDFDKNDIIDFIHTQVKLRSISFLQRWDSILKNMEQTLTKENK